MAGADDNATCPVTLLSSEYCSDAYEHLCTKCVLWGVAWPWLVVAAVCLAAVPLAGALANLAVRLTVLIMQRLLLGKKSSSARVSLMLSSRKRSKRTAMTKDLFFSTRRVIVVALLFAAHRCLHVPSEVKNVTKYLFALPLVLFLFGMSSDVFSAAITMLVVEREDVLKQRAAAMPASSGELKKHIAMSTNAYRESLSVVKFMLLLFLSILFLESLDVPVVKFVQSTTLLGIAFAFSIQPWLRNMISAILIFADGNVSVGDRIAVDGVEGVVESITLRSTVLRLDDRSISYVPNTKLTEQEVLNGSRRSQRLIRARFRVATDTSAEQLERAVSAIKAKLGALHPSLCPNDDGEFASSVYIENIFQVLVTWYSENITKETHEAVRGEVALAINEVLEMLHVNVVYSEWASDKAVPKRQSPTGAARNTDYTMLSTHGASSDDDTMYAFWTTVGIGGT